MNRFHVHLNVADLATSIRFYTALFGAEPTVRKDDYAKWMVEDPRVNFAISSTGRAPGVDHLGIQADSGEALAALGHRLDAAGGTLVPEEATVCCYARSDKLWTEDPQGTRWETFHTLGEATTHHGGEAPCATDGASCSPDLRAVKPKVAKGGACCATDSGCC
ncbi:MAG TPA: ArsI/CadI family heavy metal resistance metalloenzyme [Frateuria sp.]|uniref:ArsI/CadI family heavy metal resistance metalloenzyme n=1 Tax=Frateuria sp. TaxID=2211372 RepID=UPI002D800056|nr:ArsI/CadI family heavy metal resistance metalloenzyme [Frateuria sp.]HET6806913.1 ArsI/CadI family heavy metal resistance metalloenzyme [Frateuria sp.]